MLGKSILNSFKKEKIKIFSPNRNELNLFSRRKIENYLKKNRFTHVINCAARVGGILDNTNNQILYYESNMEMNYNLIYTCKKFEIKNFLNLGSSCMYPKNYNKKMNEKMLMTGPLEETNFTYALSKLSAAYYLNSIRSKYNFNYSTLIPCNLFGPYDKFDEIKSHLIPAIINKLQKAKKYKENQIVLWGNGKVKREFLYIENLSNYIVKLVLNNVSLPPFLNLGASKDHSVLFYYKKIMDLSNLNLKIVYDLSKPDGMKRKLIDSSLAINKYGWKVNFDLDYGIKKTIKFYKNNYV